MSPYFRVCLRWTEIHFLHSVHPHSCPCMTLLITSEYLWDVGMHSVSLDDTILYCFYFVFSKLLKSRVKPIKPWGHYNVQQIWSVCWANSKGPQLLLQIEACWSKLGKIQHNARRWRSSMMHAYIRREHDGVTTTTREGGNQKRSASCWRVSSHYVCFTGAYKS